jgi:tetratricopeptide (TPR) repeat protein
MKKFFLIALLFAAAVPSVYGQEWRDSLDHARALYKKGKYNEALKYYKSAEQLGPEGVNLAEEKGQSAYRSASYSEAEKAFRAATKHKDPKKRSAAYNNLGSARLKQKNLSGAQEAFKQALRLDPSNEKARQNLAEAKRIQKEEEQKKQEEQQDQKSQKDQQDQKKQQQGKGNPKDQKPGDQQQNNPGKPKPQPGEGNPQPGTERQKLADKHTDRKLDDLMRQEMETKKRLDGSKSIANGKAAKKDW